MRNEWDEVKLGDVCVLENGDRGKNYPGRKAFVKTGVAFINAGHLTDNGIDMENMNYIPKDRFDLLSSGKIRDGDLLFCLRGSLGKYALVKELNDGAIASSLVIIRPKARLDKYFLAAYFGSKFCASMIKKYSNGAAQPNLSAKSLASFDLPLPPLPEQKRIVAILDEAFEGIDRAVANAEKNLANARELFESYLNNVFTQKGDGWVEKKLGDIDLIQIIDGDRGTNYPKKADFLSEGFCLFLNTKNVRSDGFNFDSTMFITEEKDKALRKGKLKRRDVLLTTRGTIGNIALYDDSVDFDEIRINSGMLIFRPNENLIVSEYLFEILRSRIVKSQIERYVSGAAQPQLPIKTLVNFTIPVPTNLDDQKNIVSRLRNWLVETNHLQSIYQRKLTALTELKQSLLQKAFSGELIADVSTKKEAVA